jgi:hypothetical protein
VRLTPANARALPRLRPLPALVVATLLLLTGCAEAGAQLPQAPAALPQLWGVAVDDPTLHSLDRSVLRKLRRAGITLIAADSLSAAGQQRLASVAKRWRLRVFKPARVAAASEAGSMCRALLAATPAGRCAIRSPSLAAAPDLARRADVVVASARSRRVLRRQVRRVRAGRLAVVLPLKGRRYSKAGWRAAIRIANGSRRVDLVVRPSGRRKPRALRRYAAQVARLAGDHVPPRRPAGLAATGSGPVVVTWRRAARRRVAAYGVYRDGRLVRTVKKPSVSLAMAACGARHVAIDAVDRAGNRSAKRSVSAGGAPCGAQERPVGPGAAPAPGVRLPDPTPEPPAPPPGTAHLWIDASGGSCTRSATPAAYNDATACGTLDAAYDRSACGDTVNLRPGGYGGGWPYVTGDRSCAGSYATVFQTEPGQPDAVVGAIATPPGEAAQGPDWMILRRLTFAPIPADGFYTDSQSGVGFFEGTTHVTVDDVDMGSFFITGSADIVIRNSDIGPCEAVATSNVKCSNNKIAYSDDPAHRTERLLIEENRIHDFRYSASCWTAGADCHWEAMFINSARDYTIRANRFSGCSNSGCVYVTLFGSPDYGNDGLAIENNWFEMSWREDQFGPASARVPVAVSLGHCEGFGGDDYDWTWVRFNSFATGSQINHAADSENCQVGAGGYHVVGNVMSGGHANCPRYVDFSYNVVAGGACGSTARDIGGSLAGVYLNDVNTPAKDLHLRGSPGSTAADDYVPESAPGGCPNIDHERRTRPVGARCDAGAHER